MLKLPLARLSRAEVATFVLAVFLAAAPARPQNWLENGEFTADTTPWQIGNSGTGLFEWSEVDHAGGTGSVLISSTDTAHPIRSVYQCTFAREGDTYDARAWFFIQDGQVYDGYVQLFVAWYSDTTCDSQALGLTGTAPISTTNAWVLGQINEVVAPEVTIRARVFFHLHKSNSSPELRVHADGARLIPHPFFADGFGAGNTDAWSDVAP